MPDSRDLERVKLQLEIDVLRQQLRPIGTLGASMLRLLSAFGASVAGLTAILYAVGYLIAFGYSAKLGLPLGPVATEAYLIQGARFPLGLTSAVLELYMSSRWIFWSTSFVLAALLGLAFARARIGDKLPPRSNVHANPKWILAIAWPLLLASLYLSWQASQATNLLLGKRARLEPVFQVYGDLRHSERLRDKERTRAAPNLELLDQYARDLADRQQQLRSVVSALPLAERIVYWLFFQAIEEGVRLRLTGYYLLILVLTALAATAAVVWFVTTRAQPEGTRIAHAAALGGGLFLGGCLLMFNYGLLMQRSEAHVVRLSCEGPDRALLGSYGDRLVFFEFDAPALRLIRGDNLAELCVVERADVLSRLVSRE